MDKAEPPSPGGTSDQPPPADARRRALARLLDLALSLLPLFFAHRRTGALAAAALLLAGDALFGPGRSLGKRLFGLRAVALPSQRPAELRESLLRNAPFALPLAVLAALPSAGSSAGGSLVVTLGTLAALGVVLALEAAVALRPLSRDLGRRRLGDLLARTQVVDASKAVRLLRPLRPPQPSAAAPFASRAA